MDLPPKYLANLTPSQRVLQEKLISKSKKQYEKTGEVEARPKVSSKPSPRSPYVKRFEKKYGYKITDLTKVKDEFHDSDIDKILSKGRAAYMSSGSRPNQTPNSWAFARLASVLTGGKALKVDKDLVGSESLSKIKR